jgi:hypothetical protein
MEARAWGEDTRFEHESLDEEEGKVAPPPHSPPHETLPSLSDIFHRQAGVMIDARRPKWTWTKIGSSTGSPP